MRNMTAILFRQNLGCSLNRLGLVAKETGRLDVLLQLAWRHLEVVFRLLVLPKQIGSNDVDTLISTLRGKYRGNQQLKRITVIQRTLRVRISALESPNNIARPCFEFVGAFAFHPVLFNFPVFLAHASIRTNAQRPAGKSITPIKARISNSCETADSGAPARCSAVELLFPTPNNFRQADNV